MAAIPVSSMSIAKSMETYITASDSIYRVRSKKIMTERRSKYWCYQLQINSESKNKKRGKKDSSNNNNEDDSKVNEIENEVLNIDG